VLGAGFFTSQTAQATVHTGVQQASSSLEMVGNIYGVATAGTAHLDYVNATVALTAGGTAMDLSQMVISYNDGTTLWSNVQKDNDDCAQSIAGNAAFWCISHKVNANADNLLEPNEQFVITVSMPTTTTPNTKFKINFQPAVGAVLPIERTVPGGISTVQPLY